MQIIGIIGSVLVISIIVIETINTWRDGSLFSKRYDGTYSDYGLNYPEKKEKIKSE